MIARRLVPSDAAAMTTIYGDRETVRYVGDGEPLDEETCQHWIEVTDRNFDIRGYGMVALESKSTGELIGCIGIVHPDQQELPELKYSFRQDQWGGGIGQRGGGGDPSFCLGISRPHAVDGDGGAGAFGIATGADQGGVSPGRLYSE